MNRFILIGLPKIIFAILTVKFNFNIAIIGVGVNLSFSIFIDLLSGKCFGWFVSSQVVTYIDVYVLLGILHNYQLLYFDISNLINDIHITSFPFLLAFYL